MLPAEVVGGAKGGDVVVRLIAAPVDGGRPVAVNSGPVAGGVCWGSDHGIWLVVPR